MRARRTMRRPSALPTLLSFLFFLPPLLSPQALGAQTTGYLNFDDFTRELRSVVESSDLATMTSAGTTLGGREVWVVTVGSRSSPDLDTRPGVLVVGNLEGDHLVGSHLALDALRYILGSQDDEAVRTMLDTQVLYVFPRLNPDGAEAYFAQVKSARKTNSLPWDEDNDGRIDEDGPDDLNRDGFITVMRKADPAGAFMIDPTDGRAMKRAEASKGESGAFKVYFEGIDNDGDGFINEDGPGGVDLNRNFQHAYPYWQGDAGPHMVSEVETRAVMDFAIAHRNIAAVLTFGQTDNLVTPPDSRGQVAAAKVPALDGFAAASLDEVFTKGVFAAAGGGRGRGGGGRGGGGGSWLRGAQPGRDNDPSSGTRPATTVATQDQVYFKAVSDAYQEITGIQHVPIHRKPEGAFFDYGYFQFGVPSFTTPGWGVPGGGSGGASARAGGDASPPASGATGAAAGRGGGRPAGAQAVSGAGASAGDAALLAAYDSAGIDAFVEWTPFDHPELGEVEIGGFAPYVTVNPPAEQLADLGEKHGQFLVKLAGMLPRARIVDVEVEAHGGGVFTVKATVENTGFFPTSTQHGVRSRSVGPTLLQIQVDPEAIITGADKTTSVGVLNGSGAREEVTWIIRGRAGADIEIKLLSQKSGQDSHTVTLR